MARRGRVKLEPIAWSQLGEVQNLSAVAVGQIDDFLSAKNAAVLDAIEAVLVSRRRRHGRDGQDERIFEPCVHLSSYPSCIWHQTYSYTSNDLEVFAHISADVSQESLPHILVRQFFNRHRTRSFL